MNRYTVIAGVLAVASLLALPTLGNLANSEDAPKPDSKTPQTPPTFIDAPISRAPEAIASFGAAELGGSYFVLGGHLGHNHEHSSANQSAAFRCLNSKGEWSELPGGVALQSVALVAHDGKLIRIGGMAAKNKPGEKDDLQSSDQVAEFDPALKTWRDLPPLPVARSSHDACVLAGQLYVFGGWKLTGNSRGQWPQAGLVLNLNAEKPAWQPIAQPFKRRAVAVTAAKGKVYVMGGLSEAREVSQDVDIFDVATAKWTKGPALLGSGFGCSACQLDGRIFATDFSGRLARLSEDDSKWEDVCRLAIPRFFHRLLPAGKGKLVAMCGSAADGHTNTVEWIDVASTGPRISTLKLPYKGNAKQRQGLFAQGNSLTLFGGNTETEQHMFEKENFSNQVWRMDILTGESVQLKDLPVQRQSLLTLAVDGTEPGQRSLYAFGGFGFEGETTVSHAQIFAYDDEKDAWADAGLKLPLPLTQFGLVTFKGKVWMFGGMEFDPRRDEDKQFQFSDSVYCWDPATKTGFVEVAKLPRSRRAFGCAEVGGKVYLVGGLKQEFGKVPECDVFDLETKTWATMPEPAKPRVSASLVSLDGKLWLIGGSSPRASSKGISTNNTLEVFDPKTNSWSTLLEKLPVNLKETQCFATETRLVIYSAAQDGEFVEITLVDPGR